MVAGELVGSGKAAIPSGVALETRELLLQGYSFLSPSIGECFGSPSTVVLPHPPMKQWIFLQHSQALHTHLPILMCASFPAELCGRWLPCTPTLLPAPRKALTVFFCICRLNSAHAISSLVMSLVVAFELLILHTVAVTVSNAFWNYIWMNYWNKIF